MHFMKAFTVTGLLLTLTLTAGCGLLPREEEEPAPQLAAPIKSEKQTYTVRRGAVEEKISLRANWTPVNTRELFFKNGGRVRAVYTKSGESVKAGQVLAELFADDTEYQLAQARLRLEKVKLSQRDVAYRSQFNQTPALETEQKRLELDRQAGELEVAHYEGLLAETRLVAPFDGVVSRVSLKVGDSLAPYAVVMRIEDPTTLWVEADVDDAALTRLAVGQKVRLDFSDVKDVAGGTLVELPDPQITAQSPGSSGRKVKVQPDQVSQAAKMGMVGKVHVIMQQKPDVLLLDSAAVRRFSDRTYVLTKEPRREVDVTVGIVGENVSEIVKGLKEGDEVLGR